MKFLTLILTFSLFFITVTLTPFVFAEDGVQAPPPPCNNFLSCLGNAQVKGLDPKFTTKDPGGFVGVLLGLILPIAIGIGGMLTVIFIVLSGIQFITSGGDPKGASAAKDRLVYAVIGFIVLILAFAVLQIIDKIFLKSGIT